MVAAMMMMMRRRRRMRILRLIAVVNRRAHRPQLRWLGGARCRGGRRRPMSRESQPPKRPKPKPPSYAPPAALVQRSKAPPRAHSPPRPPME
eukprot:5627522-Pyramimonas_sp.AAC.1